MFSGPLEDRLLIRERYGAYSDATCQQNLDGWLACWHDDGVWAIFGKEFSGKAALCQQWHKTWSRLDNMGFFSELGAVEINGDRATARSYCREIAALKSGGIFKVVACYHDELVKVNGDWLFAKRTYELLITE